MVRVVSVASMGIPYGTPMDDNVLDTPDGVSWEAEQARSNPANIRKKLVRDKPKEEPVVPSAKFQPKAVELED